MKQITDELIDLFLYSRSNIAAWLQIVVGIGHKIESEKGAIGYYTGKYGFWLESDGNQYNIQRGEQTFAVADNNGVAAYIYLTGNITYQALVDEIVTTTYPLTITLIGDATNIEQYANALAFALQKNIAVDNVSLNHNKPENLLQAAKTSRRTRNTSTGVANIAFTFTIQQGDDCLIIDNCK